MSNMLTGELHQKERYVLASYIAFIVWIRYPNPYRALAIASANRLTRNSDLTIIS